MGALPPKKNSCGTLLGHGKGGYLNQDPLPGITRFPPQRQRAPGGAGPPCSSSPPRSHPAGQPAASTHPLAAQGSWAPPRAPQGRFFSSCQHRREHGSDPQHAAGLWGSVSSELWCLREVLLLFPLRYMAFSHALAFVKGLSGWHLICVYDTGREPPCAFGAGFLRRGGCLVLLCQQEPVYACPVVHSIALGPASPLQGNLVAG